MSYPTVTVKVTSGSRLSGVYERIANISEKFEIASDARIADFTHQSYLQTYKAILSELNSISSDYWYGIMVNAGTSVYGAVALSWCEGAELAQVWEGWEASGFPLKPLPEYERPARFINPALLPATNSLKELVDLVEAKSLPICALMVAKRDTLEMDLPDAMARVANPQVAAFLKAHTERKPSRTPEDIALIAVWSKTIKGTEFDVTKE